MVKNPPGNAGDMRDLGSIPWSGRPSGGGNGRRHERPGFDPWSGNPLEEEMATHSSILAWRILWMEEPGRVQSIGSQRVGRIQLTDSMCAHKVSLSHCSLDCLISGGLTAVLTVNMRLE